VWLRLRPVLLQALGRATAKAGDRTVDGRTLRSRSQHRLESDLASAHSHQEGLSPQRATPPTATSGTRSHRRRRSAYGRVRPPSIWSTASEGPANFESLIGGGYAREAPQRGADRGVRPGLSGPVGGGVDSVRRPAASGWPFASMSHVAATSGYRSASDRGDELAGALTQGVSGYAEPRTESPW